MAGFEDAVQELYQVPLTQFVAERKRLADTLKSGGDAPGAKKLLARKRPTISAWVVNQLYWHARDAFDDLLATAEKLRKGDLKASASHRDAIAKLRARASTLLKEAGNAPTESTLRRVTTTLSAIAVAGGFDPDPPGALAEDRDPPGFAAFGISSSMDEVPATDAGTHHDELAVARAKRHTAHGDGHSKHEKATDKEERAAEREQEKLAKAAEKAREAEAAAQRAADMAEKKREEAEKKRVAIERHRLESALRTAKAELHERERDVKQLEKQLETAQKAIERAQEIVDDLAAKLDDLDGN